MSGSAPQIVLTTDADSVGGSPAADVNTATQLVVGTKTQKTFLAAPNGADGAASFRTIAASDVPTLNQNTSGSAATATSITGNLSGDVSSSGMTTTIGAKKVLASMMKSDNGAGGNATAGYIPIADGSGGVAYGAVAATPPNSTIHLNTGNGFGSTNNVIRRFTTVTESTGTDITYADDATNGATFTINTAGVYAINYNDYNGGGAGDIGISKNSNQLTTDIKSITAAHRVAYTDQPSGYWVSVSCVVHCAVNDVIRAHTDGSQDTDGLTMFRIVRVA